MRIARNRNFKRSKAQKFAIKTLISRLIVPNDSFPLPVIFHSQKIPPAVIARSSRNKKSKKYLRNPRNTWR